MSLSFLYFSHTYQYRSTMKSVLSADQIKNYNKDGYIILRNHFNMDEVERLYQSALKDEAVKKNALDLNDQSGRKTKLSLWFTPGDDAFGYMSRCRRIVEAIRPLLDSDAPVCHFHSKLMQKEPRIGGAWEWHQDYGYWYKNQFMYPDQLISVMLALTEANRQNGCLQVIKGSHKMGRVNHGFAGEQVGADMVMVSNALKTMDLVYCELKPGDVLIFHSNLLHRSEANLSEYPRWSVISCYCSQSNLAYNESSTSWKVSVDIVPEEAILHYPTHILEHADFLKKEDDPALKSTGWETEINHQ